MFASIIAILVLIGSYFLGRFIRSVSDELDAMRALVEVLEKDIWAHEENTNKRIEHLENQVFVLEMKQ